MYFNDTSAYYIGLFGYTGDNSEIKNVGVVNSYFCDNNYVGDKIFVEQKAISANGAVAKQAIAPFFLR